MSGIGSIKAALHFVAAQKRPACRNCAHCEARTKGPDAPERAAAFEYHCNLGGFMVSGYAICLKHEPVK